MDFLRQTKTLQLLNADRSLPSRRKRKGIAGVLVTWRGRAGRKPKF